MVTFLRRFIGLGIALVALTFGAVVYWTLTWPDRDSATLGPADAIICLGGDLLPSGELGPAGLLRASTCVELWQDGVAPVLLFTGAGNPDIAEASAMAAFASGQNVPASAILIEPVAESTLQNALFSLPMIPEAERVILVSEAFHLPRSAASFRWAAWELDRRIDVQTAMSHQVRRTPEGRVIWSILGRETAAIWFNLARAAAYSAVPSAQIGWLH
ncbi:MAG: YdcF family protein [Pseudomonadota bacterium]